MAHLDPDPLDGCYPFELYIEFDYPVFLEKGAGIDAYIADYLEQARRLFEGDGLEASFIVKVWTEPSPYNATTSSGALGQFRAKLNAEGGHPGDLAMLMGVMGSGGVNYVDILCNQSFGVGYCSINMSYRPYPEYSWDLMVLAHEVGHGLGSPHSHSCSWPGGAIDGCSPFGVEGSCDDPGLPARGAASIMSYCHLQSSVGIDLSYGFGPLPLTLIKNKIASAACVECVGDPDDPEPELCDSNQVTIEVLVDLWAQETSWEVLNNEGDVIAESEPYPKFPVNYIYSDTLCLPNGCYDFVIKDIDGLEGRVSDFEGMYIVNGENDELASGQAFTNQETTRFCLGVTPPDGDCQDVLLRADSLIDYANQSRSPWAIVTDIEGGVTVEGNNWRALPYSYNITPNTVLTFEALIETVGEIQGVALLDNIRSIYPDRSFRFGGTQNWGIAIEQIIIGEWVNVTIPIGQYFTGEVTHVVLINDDDHRAVVKTGWRNMEICESGQAGLKMGFAEPQGAAKDEAWSDNRTIEGYDIARRAKERRPHPNPTTDTLILPLETMWHLYGVNGRLIDEGWGSKVDLSLLPTGFYLLHDGTTTHKVVKK